MRALLGLTSLALILACSGGKEDGGGGIFGDDTGDDGGGGLIPRDNDDDGYRDNVDCDDGDASVNPGASEAPYDGVDNDCDPSTPDDDLDGDGYGQALDCDDQNAAVNPGQTEIAGDGLDNDCDASTCLNPGFASGATSWGLPGGYGSGQFSQTAYSGYCSSGYDTPSYTTMDLTGDGRSDLVVSYHCGDGSLGDTTWAVHENTGSRFAAGATSWGLPGGYGSGQFSQTAYSGYCSSGYDLPAYTTMDMTGDGLPDLVVSYHCGDGSLGDTSWAVHENTGSRFAAGATSWGLPSGYGSGHFTQTSYSGYCSSGYDIPSYTTTDMTGDGRPDLVVTNHCGDGSLGDTTWAVHENTGSGFAQRATSWSLPSGYGSEHFTQTTYSGYCSSGYDIPSYSLSDMTGDGLADLVVSNHCGDGSLGDTTWAVHENTGAGFSSTPTSWSLPTDYGSEHFTQLAYSGYCSSGYDIPSYTTTDLSGDGQPDLVVSNHCGDGGLGDARWALHAGSSGGFASASTWPLPSGYGDSAFTQLAYSGYCSSGYDLPSYTTMDLTGDRRADLVVSYHCGDGGLGDTSWAVHEGDCDL